MTKTAAEKAPKSTKKPAAAPPALTPTVTTKPSAKSKPALVVVKSEGEKMVDDVPRGDDVVRQRLHKYNFLHVFEVQLPTGKGAIGRENLPVDEMLIYSLLTSMVFGEEIFLDGTAQYVAYSPDQRMLCSSWGTTAEKNVITVTDGRQRYKAEREINTRMGMLHGLITENKGDLDKARGAAVALSKTSAAWKWAKEIALPMYIGGKIGDATQNIECAGLLRQHPETKEYSIVEYAVFTDWNPLNFNPHDRIAMLGIAQRTEFSRVGTPPSIDAMQLADMCKVLPMAHVAQLRDCDERTIRNRTRILKLDPKVIAAIDLGGNKGGISWTQAMDHMFTKPAKAGGELEPLPPEKQLAILPRISGKKTRGGDPNKVPKAAVLFKGTEEFFSELVGSLDNLQGQCQEAIDAGTVSEDQSPLIQVEIAYRVALFMSGDTTALDANPDIKAVFYGSMLTCGMIKEDAAAPESAESKKEAPAPVSREITLANNLQDLFTRWGETRTTKTDENNNSIHTPTWPEVTDLAPEVKEALGDIRIAYHNKLAERAADDNSMPDKTGFALDYINAHYLSLKDAPAADKQMELPATADGASK